VCVHSFGFNPLRYTTTAAATAAAATAALPRTHNHEPPFRLHFSVQEHLLLPTLRHQRRHRRRARSLTPILFVFCYTTTAAATAAAAAVPAHGR